MFLGIIENIAYTTSFRIFCKWIKFLWKNKLRKLIFIKKNIIFENK